MSSKGSADLEDWLDIGDDRSVKNLSLEDALNEVENLDEGLSFTAETIQDGDLESISNLCETPLGIEESPFTYQLDSAVAVHSHHTISHQISSLKAKSGSAVAIAERNGQIVVVTSRGHMLLFDLDGKLDRYHQGEEWTGSASYVTFSLDGKHIAVGFAKGAVKIISVQTGVVQHVIRDACQPGLGIIQVVYLTGSSSFLTLDNGGSVFEIRINTSITGKKSHTIRCIFSGCNGEVVNMRILPNRMLALLTVSKLLLVSTRLGGCILGSFPLDHSFSSPPLFAYWIGNNKSAEPHSPLKSLSVKTFRDFRVCISRGQKMVIFRLHVSNFNTNHKSATIHKNINLPVSLANLHWISKHMIIGIDDKGQVWQIDTEKGKCIQTSAENNLELIFATSDFKGSAIGGKVSEAMCSMANMACYQSISCASSTCDRLIILAHNGLRILEKVTEWEQLELFKEKDDVISASLYLLDVFRGKVKSHEVFRKEVPDLLRDRARDLLDKTMNGITEGRVTELMAHYKKHIRILLHISITGKILDFLYEDMWNRLSLDCISKTILLESLEEYVLDGALVDPPPTIVSEYLQHLAAENHYSQFEAAVVRFPIYTLDIHSVMSICRQNGLYDGIIYVMNNALLDYISPLEEMLEAIQEFAPRGMYSDNEVLLGNRILLYLNCCLTGRAYPHGMLDDANQKKVPFEVYRCISSLKGKDGSSSTDNYPYLRLLIQFDPQQFIHLICTCADAPLFQEDGRLQRITDIIGLICISLKEESPLINFLHLVVQLLERNMIISPTESVQDSIESLLRITPWEHPPTEREIVSALRTVNGIDRNVVLRMAQTPMRPGICSYLYLSDRQFMDLIKCYVDSNNKEVFTAIDDILRTGDMEIEESIIFNRFIQNLLPDLMRIDCLKCATVILDHFAHYLKTMNTTDKERRRQMFPVLSAILAVRKERKQTMISADDDIDEDLFGIVFEGICKNWEGLYIEPSDTTQEIDDILMDHLSFWLPTGSRTDFCLNLAASTETCTRSVVQLLEARGHVDRAFEVLFEQLEKYGGFDDTLTIRWLDESLSFCSRHSSHDSSNDWMLQVFRFVASQIGHSTDKEQQTQIDKRLQVLCRRIIDAGTEHAVQLVQSLFESPVFKNSTYQENANLISEIFDACKFEEKLLTSLVDVMNSETTDLTRNMYSFVGVRSEMTSIQQCISCSQPLNKSAYVFRCGHYLHIECSTSSKKACICDGNSQILPVHRHIERKIEKKDIFVDWDTPLNLRPRNVGK